MSDFETLMETLNQQAIENAGRIDPSIKEKVEADRKEIEEHDKRIEAQRSAVKEEPKTEYHDLWQKMKTPKP